MSRLFAIGDIHGCLSPLNALIDAIEPTKDDTIIFLGDMVDRGPDTKGVLDRIMALETTCKVIAIAGNHEEMMIGSVTELEYAKSWLRFGGAQALASFGLPDTPDSVKDIPFKYIYWLKNLARCIIMDDFIFCHGAANPKVPIEKQNTELRWRFLNKEDSRHISGKTIICGHSEQRNGEVWQQDGLICIDTYAYGGGKLTALQILSVNHFVAWQVAGQSSSQNSGQRTDQATCQRRMITSESSAPHQL
ncbi:MAG: metallophosphoesterase family protein [Psychrobacter sp.]|nr:metallophosphoesterase family protein [Psychrobacter sp.]